MFFIVSPSKPHKNRAKNHKKLLPKIKIKFGLKTTKYNKNKQINRREKKLLTSGESSGRRGRERGGRGGRMREREGEREREGWSKMGE